MTIDEVRALHPLRRIAGYLRISAQLAELGAELRLKSDDDFWTPEEQTKWDNLVDEADPWWIGMDDEEKAIIRKRGVEYFFAEVTCGEWPLRSPQEALDILKKEEEQMT